MARSSQLQKFSKALINLYGADLDLRSFPKKAIVFISELLPCELCAYGAMDRGTGEIAMTFSHHPPQLASAMEAFGEHMAKYPLFSFDPTVNLGKPFKRSDFFSSRQFRNLDIYQETYRPLGLTNHFAIFVDGPASHARFIGVERKTQGDFSQEEHELAELAQQHLATAFRIAALKRDSGLVDPGCFAGRGYTAREAEVLFWLTEGKTNVEIATLLGVGPETVKSHLKSIFRKAGVENRLSATLYALGLAREHTANVAREFVFQARISPGRGIADPPQPC